MTESHGQSARRGAASEGEIDLGVLDDYVGFHLQLAQSASFHAFKRLTGMSRLRAGWFTVLSLIADNPGITPVALSRASGRDKSTITPLLQDLTRDALVERQRTPGDRRSFRLHITDVGRDQLDHLARCAAEHEAAITAVVGDHRAALVVALRRIVADLD